MCRFSSVFFLLIFFFLLWIFYILCTQREKNIFGYCNWQACTVVYATAKYLLYHLYIAKTIQQIEKYTNK